MKADLKLREVADLNNEFLKRLCCVHYPFSIDFIKDNVENLKWGNRVYSDIGHVNECTTVITRSLYGMCYNCNIDRNAFFIENIPFETTNMTSYCFTGIYGVDELPMMKNDEFKNYMDIVYHENLSPQDYPEATGYFNGFVYEDWLKLEHTKYEYFKKINEAKGAPYYKFRIKHFEELENLCKSIQPIYALSVNLFAQTMVFLDEFMEDWIDVIFRKQ